MEKEVELFRTLKNYKHIWHSGAKNHHNQVVQKAAIDKISADLNISTTDVKAILLRVHLDILSDIKNGKIYGTTYVSKYKNSEIYGYFYDELLRRETVSELTCSNQNANKILFNLVIKHECLVQQGCNSKAAIDERERAWAEVTHGFRKIKNYDGYTVVMVKKRFRKFLATVSTKMLRFLKSVKFKNPKASAMPTEFDKHIIKYFPRLLSGAKNILQEFVYGSSDKNDVFAEPIEYSSLENEDASTMDEMVDLTDNLCRNEALDDYSNDNSNSVHFGSASQQSSSSSSTEEIDLSFFNQENYEYIDLDSKTISHISEEDYDRYECNAYSQRYKSNQSSRSVMLSLMLIRTLAKQTYSDLVNSTMLSDSEPYMYNETFWKIISAELEDVGFRMQPHILDERWKEIMMQTRERQRKFIEEKRNVPTDLSVFWYTLFTFPLLFSTNVISLQGDKFSQNNGYQNRHVVESESRLANDEFVLSNTLSQEIYNTALEGMCSYGSTSDNDSSNSLIRHPKPVKLPNRAEVLEMNKRLQTASVSPTIASLNANSDKSKTNEKNSKTTNEKQNKTKPALWKPNVKLVQTPSWMIRPKNATDIPSEPVKVFYAKKTTTENDEQTIYNNFLEVLRTVDSMKMVDPIIEDPLSPPPPSSPKNDQPVVRKRGRPRLYNRIPNVKPKRPRPVERKTKRKLQRNENVFVDENSSNSEDEVFQISEDSQSSVASLSDSAPKRAKLVSSDAFASHNTYSNKDVSKPSTLCLEIAPLAIPGDSMEILKFPPERLKILSSDVSSQPSSNNRVANNVDQSNATSTEIGPNDLTLLDDVTGIFEVAQKMAKVVSTDVVSSEQNCENKTLADPVSDVDLVSTTSVVIDPNNITISGDSSELLTSNAVSTDNLPISVVNLEDLQNIPQINIPDGLDTEQLSRYIANLNASGSWGVDSSNNPNVASLSDICLGITQLVSLDNLNNITENSSTISPLLSLQNSDNGTTTTVVEETPKGLVSGSKISESLTKSSNISNQVETSASNVDNLSENPTSLQPFDTSVLEDSAKDCNIDLRSYYSMIADCLDDVANNEIEDVANNVIEAPSVTNIEPLEKGNSSMETDVNNPDPAVISRVDTSKPINYFKLTPVVNVDPSDIQTVLKEGGSILECILKANEKSVTTTRAIPSVKKKILYKIAPKQTSIKPVGTNPSYEIATNLTDNTQKPIVQENKTMEKSQSFKQAFNIIAKKPPNPLIKTPPNKTNPSNSTASNNKEAVTVPKRKRILVSNPDKEDSKRIIVIEDHRIKKVIPNVIAVSAAGHVISKGVQKTKYRLVKLNNTASTISSNQKVPESSSFNSSKSDESIVIDSDSEESTSKSDSEKLTAKSDKADVNISGNSKLNYDTSDNTVKKTVTQKYKIQKCPSSSEDDNSSRTEILWFRRKNIRPQKSPNVFKKSVSKTSKFLEETISVSSDSDYEAEYLSDIDDEATISPNNSQPIPVEENENFNRTLSNDNKAVKFYKRKLVNSSPVKNICEKSVSFEISNISEDSVTADSASVDEDLDDSISSKNDNSMNEINPANPTSECHLNESDAADSTIVGVKFKKSLPSKNIAQKYFNKIKSDNSTSKCSLNETKYGNSTSEGSLNETKSANSSTECSINETKFTKSNSTSGKKVIKKPLNKIKSANSTSECSSNETKFAISTSKRSLNETKSAISTSKSSLNETKSANSTSESSLNETKCANSTSEGSLNETKSANSSSECSIKETKSTKSNSTSGKKVIKKPLNKIKSANSTSERSSNETKFAISTSKRFLNETKSAISTSKNSLNETKSANSTSESSLSETNPDNFETNPAELISVSEESDKSLRNKKAIKKPLNEANKPRNSTSASVVPDTFVPIKNALKKSFTANSTSVCVKSDKSLHSNKAIKNSVSETNKLDDSTSASAVPDTFVPIKNALKKSITANSTSVCVKSDKSLHSNKAIKKSVSETNKLDDSTSASVVPEKFVCSKNTLKRFISETKPDYSESSDSDEELEDMVPLSKLSKTQRKM